MPWAGRGAGRHSATVSVCALVLLGDATRGHAQAARAQALLDAGSYREAAAAARDELAELERRVGPDAPETATALDRLVEARLRNGEGARDDLRAQAERALALRSAPGAATLELAGALRRLARVRADAGERRQALPLFERALTLARALEPPDAAQLAEALEDWASAALAADNPEHTRQAEHALREIEALAAGRPTPPLKRAAHLLLRARLHRRRARYEDMRTDCDDALALIETHAPAHPDLAHAVHDRADADWFLGRYDAARAGYARALRLAEERLGSTHPYVGVCLSDVALAEEEDGAFERSLALRRRNLELTRAARGTRHPEFVDRLHGLGDVYLLLGRYAEARAQYEQALAAAVAAWGSPSQEEAALHSNLALVLARLGDMRPAVEHNRRALDIWTRVLDASHVHRARALDALGEILQESGRDTDARPLLEECVRLRAAHLHPAHPLLLRARTLLAASLVHLGDSSAALTQLDLVAAAWRAAGRPAQVAFADALARRARVLLGQGALGAARSDFENALTLLAPRLGDDHPDVAGARAGLAACNLAEGRPGEALESALRADRAHQHLVEQTLGHLSEREGLAFVTRAFEGRDLALSAVTTDRATMAQIARVFEAVVRGRARVFDAAAARARRLRAATSESDTAAHWAELQRRHAQALVRARSASLNDDSLRRLLATREAKERFERTFPLPSFGGQTARATGAARALAAVLPRETALVAFVRHVATRRRPGAGPTAAPAYAAFVLRGSSARLTLVPLPYAGEVEARVEAWRRAVTDYVAARVSPRKAERDYRLAASALGAAVWTPLLPALSGARHVVVVPDGALNVVSFPTLVGPSGKYLAEDGPRLTLLTAERDLLDPLTPARSGRGLLALGGVDYDARAAGEPREAPADTAARAPGAGCRAPGPFPALAATRSEIDALERLWRAAPDPGPVERLTGAQANEHELERAARGKRVLHLSTHAFFAPGSCRAGDGPERGFDVDLLALGGLALAGANAPGDAPLDDGLLTAEEIAALDLSGVEWAVLSACETGVGEVRAAEGVLGLARAFRLAGVRSVVTSLWRVPDDATARFMALFYEAHLTHGMSARLALDAARARVLDARRARGHSTHPFFWGAFVALGADLD